MNSKKNNILIQGVKLNWEKKDILISENKIIKISSSIDTKKMSEYKIINWENKAILPWLHNAHTHSPMSIFRWYWSDLPLQEWLGKIWAVEEKLTEDDIYWATKFSCLEMIKSGTTFFNDMYWHVDWSIKAVEEMGIRSLLTFFCIDFHDPETAKQKQKDCEKFFSEKINISDRIKFWISPHSIYTVSKDLLKWIKDFAKKHNLLIHIHMSETEKEVNDCKKTHACRPVEYLEKIDFLGSNVVMAHSVWLDDNELDICVKHNVKIAYNPASNLKLASWANFRYSDMKKRGIKPTIGTDWCGSNNNLSIFDELRIASLLQKWINRDPKILPATEAIEMATINAAKAFNLDTGKIKEWKLADFILVDLKNPLLIPNHNFEENLIHSAWDSCIDTVVCDGKILMEKGKIEGEEEIIENIERIVKSRF